MAVERQFLRDTATEPGTDGSTAVGGIFDLSAGQGTEATIGSGNTQSASFVIGKRFQKTVDDTVTGTSFPVSIDMASVSASTMEWQAKVQRVDSSNVVQAESDILGPFNTAGIKTGTLTLSTTWAAGDRLAVAVELRKVSGGGNRSFTLNVNDADSFVDADITVSIDPTRGLISHAEQEAPFVLTRGVISFAEFETPLVATRGLISWAEQEAPIALTRGLISWSEQEIPSATPDPTRGLIGWAEQEAPFVQTRGQVSFSEFEAPIAATRGRISFTEFEAAFVLTRGLMSYSELETPLAPTRGLSSWQEFGTPVVLTRGQISFAEFSVGSGDAVTTTPIPVFGYFVTPLRRHRNCQP